PPLPPGPPLLMPKVPLQRPTQLSLPTRPPLLMSKMPPHPPIDLRTSRDTASPVVDSTLQSNLILEASSPIPEEEKNWVYFVWDDEEMSMEERRMSLAKYNGEYEKAEMKKLEAKIERMLAESWLGMRMGYRNRI
ncbi:hypothetical protein KI387_014790, partial [Taxus chinensis]